MKSIAVSGTAGYIPHISLLDTATAMRRVGNNCGNLLFQYASCDLLAEPYSIVGRDIPWSPERIAETCRALLVPSANFLRERFDFTEYVSFLERANLPLVFLGLGAQADDFEKTSFDFHPSITRLLALIRERSPAVSVRGEFTARVLESYAITNFEITGCPSNFINSSPTFAESISEKLRAPMHSFITHAEEPWPKDPSKRLLEQRLAEWTRCGRSIMVQQSVPAMQEYMRKSNPASKPQLHPHLEESLRRAIMPDHDIETFRDFITTRVRTFFSVDQWMEDSAKFDFSIGPRLHGNMAAWQAGTPALWIWHDSRTRELSETMGLPSLGIKTFLDKCPTVEEARRRVEYDPRDYASRRSLLGHRLKRVFDAAGISIRNPV
jgi:hypothetical protein